MTNRKITKCPGTSDYTTANDYWGFASKGSPTANSVNSALRGANLLYAGQNCATLNGKLIRQPSKYFQNGDSRRAVDITQQAAAVTPFATTGDRPRFYMAHSQRINVNFLDGHCSALAPEEYVDLFLSDWTRDGNGTTIQWMSHTGAQMSSAWKLFTGI